MYCNCLCVRNKKKLKKKRKKKGIVRKEEQNKRKKCNDVQLTIIVAFFNKTIAICNDACRTLQ